MLAAQREEPAAAPARESPGAPRSAAQSRAGKSSAQSRSRSSAQSTSVSAAQSPSEPPSPPLNRDDLPLSRTLARAVQQRGRDSQGESCCAACKADGPESSCESGGRGHATTGAPFATLHRATDEGFFGSIWDTVNEAKDAAEDFVTNTATKLDTLAERAKYGPCKDPAPKPELPGPWQDDKGLESLRHRKKALLSKSKVPPGGSAATVKLFKQALRAWGCEILELDLLPKGATSGTFGAATAAAVKQFQLSEGLTIDGIVGAKTIGALDSYVGLVVREEPVADVGGTASQGSSRWSNREGRGSMYFATDDARLNKSDRRALTRLVNAARFTKEISFEITGFADKREHGKNNLRLAGDRAAAVREYLREELDDKYKTTCEFDVFAMGEIERPQEGETDEALKPFRRVDIVVTNVVYPEGKHCGGDILCQEWKPPQGPRPLCEQPSTEWEAKMSNIATTGLGIGRYITCGPGWTSATVEIRMAEPDEAGRRCQQRFIYSGWGVSCGVEAPSEKLKDVGDSISTGPVGYSTGNEWEPFWTDEPMLVQDFAGEATYSSVGATVAYGYSADLLYMPAVSVTRQQTVVWTGPGAGLGIGAGKDFWGKLIAPYAARRIDHNP